MHKSEQIEDEIPDNYEENEKSKDQGPAKEPSIAEEENSEDDFEQKYKQKPGSDDHDKEEDEHTEEIESEQNVQSDLEKPVGKVPDGVSNKAQDPDQQSNGPDSPGQTPQNNDTKNKAAKKKKHLRFDQLSDQALYILYTMTIYIGENEPEDLFSDFIYEQLIKTRKNQNMVELITAKDFFNVLLEHEVISKPETNEIQSLYRRLKTASDIYYDQMPNTRSY